MRTRFQIGAGRVAVAGATSLRPRVEDYFNGRLRRRRAANKEGRQPAQSVYHDGQSNRSQPLKGPDSGDCDRLPLRQRKRKRCESLDLPATSEKNAGRIWKSATFARPRGDINTILRRISDTRGRRVPFRAALAAPCARRRHFKSLRSRTLRPMRASCTYEPACAVKPVYGPSERQSRHRRDGGQPAASGRTAFLDRSSASGLIARRLMLHVFSNSNSRRTIRQARRFCASENLNRNSPDAAMSCPDSLLLLDGAILAGHRLRHRHAGAAWEGANLLAFRGD